MPTSVTAVLFVTTCTSAPLGCGASHLRDVVALNLLCLLTLVCELFVAFAESGRALRRCGPGGEWEDPDVSSCHSPEFSQITEEVSL